MVKTDSASCLPTGFRVLLSICTLVRFYVSKIDVKSAFLQSSKGNRNVYAIPPQECTERSFYWIWNLATHGLVNANAKWQQYSDITILYMGLKTVVHSSST